MMECGLLLLGHLEPLSLPGDHMQQLWTADLFHVPQNIAEVQHIVTVHGSEIPEIE